MPKTYNPSSTQATAFPSQPRVTGYPINKWMREVTQTLKSLVERRTGRDTVINYMLWRGDWNSQAGYVMGDVVLSNTTGSMTSGSHQYQRIPGIYLCVRNVPAHFDTTGLGGAALNQANLYNRPSTISCDPVYPYPGTQYWQLLSMLPQTMSVCVDGQSTTYYVESYPQSGSV